MAKIIKEKYDLLTLATKQVLIGSNIHFEDGVSLDIVDYYIDYRTSEIHVEYAGGSGDNLDLNEKYVVSVPSTYKTVKPKKKVKKAKKNK